MRRSSVLLGASLLILVVVLLLKAQILGGASYVSLQNGALSLAVSKGLASSTYPNYIPMEVKDFTISGTHYFNGTQWVVVNISGITGDSGVMVLEQTNGVYRSVLGPLNSLTGVDLSAFPKTVQAYISSGGQ